MTNPRLRAAAALVVFVPLAPLATLAPLPAAAGPFENMVEVCADPSYSPAEALKFCQNALNHSGMDRQPSEVRARVAMNAGIAAYELGRWAEAADSQTRAIEADPRLGAAYGHRARAYERMGRPAEALTDYEAAIRLSPNDANALLGRGVMLLNAGQAEAALADFDRAAALEPDWSAPYFNRGVVLSRLGDYARAEADFSAVLAQEPDDAQALINRGKVRMALGLGSARDDFDRALALRPEWGAGWFARGEFHDFAGDREAANADYMRAYQLGHSDPRLIERMRQLGGG